MKINSFINKKKDNTREMNILLENVCIVYTHLDKPDSEGEYADNKYSVTCLLPKSDEQTKKLMSLLKDISIENNNKEIKSKSKYYPIKDKDLEEIQEKIDAEQDDVKRESYMKYLLYAKENFFFKIGSLYEVNVIDLKGNKVEELEKVAFNGQRCNIQFKLTQPKGKNYFSRFLSGVQMHEVVRLESHSMFDIQEDDYTNDSNQIDDSSILENDDELPF